MKSIIHSLKKALTAFSSCALLAAALPVPAAASGSSIFIDLGNEEIAGPFHEEEVFSPLTCSGLSSAGRKTNTIMIYMVGSDLESGSDSDGNGGAASLDLLEMLHSGVDVSDTNVLIYTGGSYSWKSSVPNDRNTVLYLDEGGTATFVAETDTVSDMGIPQSLTDFVNFSTEYFPADDYALIFWDHGGGPLLPFGKDEFFYSDDVGIPFHDLLTMQEFSEAMENTLFSGEQKLAFVYFDTCLSASLEVADYWRNYADYMIASEEDCPGNGADYSFLADLNDSTLHDLPISIIDRFASFYDQVNQRIQESNPARGSVDWSLSCLDLAAIDGVSAASDRLFEQAAGGLRQGEYSDLQRLREQMYEFSPHTAGTENSFDVVDCRDAAEKLGVLYPDEAQALIDALDSFVLYQKSNISKANGVMMYYPCHSQAMREISAPFYDELSVSAAYSEYLSMVDTIRETGDPDYWLEEGSAPTEEVTSAPAEEVTPTPTEEPTPTPTEEVTPTPTEEVTPTPTEEPTPTPTEEVTPTPTEEVTPTPTEEVTPTPTEEPTPTPTEEVTPTPTEEPTPTPTEEVMPTPTEESAPAEEAAATGEPALIWQLTEEQLQSYVSVTYSIYQETSEGIYRPVLLNISADPDASGNIQIPAGQSALCLLSDQTSAVRPWPAEEISREGSNVQYRINGAIMAAGPEFSTVTDPGQPLVTILVTVDETTGQALIKSIRPVSDTVGISAPDQIDLNDWCGIYGALPEYEPAFNEDGTLQPMENWSRTPSALFQMMPVDGQMGLELRPLSAMDGPFVCICALKDSLGNVTYSHPMPFPAGTGSDSAEAWTDTQNGRFTFRVYGDHAELAGYEGSDTSLTIPSEVNGVPVTVIRRRALYGADMAERLEFPASVTVIGEDACSYLGSLKELVLPQGLRSVGYRAFADNEFLTAVNIPEGTQTVGRAAFQGCSSLQSVSIPASLTFLGDAAFAECPQLHSITVSEGCAACMMLGNVLLSADGKTLLAVPEGAGTYVKVPDGVETIAYGAFSGAASVKMAELPESVKRIENYAFYNCTGLVNLTLPSGLEYIGSHAFGSSTMMFGGDYDRASVPTVQIGAAVEHLAPFAFNGLNLTAFSVSEDNAHYASVDGFLTNKALDTLLEAPAGLTGTVAIPEGITSLQDGVFADNINVTDFVLPDSLQIIPEDAFPVAEYDTSSGEIMAVYDITFHCSEGSKAAEYADSHGINRTDA